MASITLTENDGSTRTFNESSAPATQDAITFDRGAYLPVPKRLVIRPTGAGIPAPRVYLTQGDPKEFSKANDPLILYTENLIGGAGDYTSLVIDLDPYSANAPAGAAYFHVPPRLNSCRGVRVVSDLGQPVSGTIEVVE